MIVLECFYGYSQDVQKALEEARNDKKIEVNHLRAN